MGCRYPHEPAKKDYEEMLESWSELRRRITERFTSYYEEILGAMSELRRRTIEVLTLHSPELDLSRAVYRIWSDPNRGYYAEARLTPESEPMYTQLTKEQAELLKQPEAPPELVASLFIPKPIVGLH